MVRGSDANLLPYSQPYADLVAPLLRTKQVAGHSTRFRLENPVVLHGLKFWPADVCCSAIDSALVSFYIALQSTSGPVQVAQGRICTLVLITCYTLLKLSLSARLANIGNMIA